MAFALLWNILQHARPPSMSKLLQRATYQAGKHGFAMGTIKSRETMFLQMFHLTAARQELPPRLSPGAPL